MKMQRDKAKIGPFQFALTLLLNLVYHSSGLADIMSTQAVGY